MEENNAGVEPVEKPQEEAGVETEVQVAPLEQELAALQAQYEQLEAEKAKIAEEKENYRKGMLKAKGKLPDEDLPDETAEEVIRRIAREEYLKTQEVQNAKKNEELVKSLLKKTQELATALKNRSHMTPSGGGSSVESVAPVDHFWSAQQLADLKARGLDPDKVKQNVIKNREKAGAA